MKIAGIGDNVIDRYRNLGVMFPGGNAVNVAAHAAMLGADAAYIGSIGADREGQIIKNALESLGVDLSQCIFEADSTTKKCDVNVYENEREFLGIDIGTKWAHTTDITESDLEYLKDFEVIHTSCNAKLHEEIYKLNVLEGMITFDFSVKDKYRTEEFLKMTCPYLELGQFSCDHMQEEEIKDFLRMVHGYGCKNVLATMGSRGSLFYNGTVFVKGEADYVEAVDTLGAGDSFLAALMVSLVEGGWKKGDGLKEELIANALEFAAKYSSKNCLVEGGFGFKERF